MKKLCSILLAICMMAGLGVLAAVPAGAAENPYAPPADLGALSQAEQLEYFNLVVNRVRTEKPGFQQRERERIEDMRLSGVAGLVNDLVNSIKNQLMPGDWLERSVDAGQSNVGLFMSENENASDLRPEDISSIRIAKQGDNWVIEVGVKEETNPAKGLNSAHGRISPIATREEVIAEMTGVTDLITAAPNDATLRYYNGFVRVTVNEQGQVIVAANGFQVYAQVNNISISVITTNVAVTQSTERQYAHFDWAPQEDFSSANVFPPAQWWEALPSSLQWLLRYVFFGWLWMG